MWFLNIKTNMKWNITDKYHIERLLEDTNYKVIEVIEKVASEKSNTNEDRKDIDYNSMDYRDLQQLCKEKGLNSYGKKKEELIELLQE